MRKDKFDDRSEVYTAGFSTYSSAYPVNGRITFLDIYVATSRGLYDLRISEGAWNSANGTALLLNWSMIG